MTDRTTSDGWTPLSEVTPGMAFKTKNGTYGVMSEYYYSNAPDAGREIILDSGEFGHFKDKDELVLPFELSDADGSAVEIGRLRGALEQIRDILNSGGNRRLAKIEGVIVEIFGDDDDE